MKPNLTLPLAPSYDQRFPLGDAGAQAGYDQRKVNAIYEVIPNPVTGKTTLILAKRPGVIASAGVPAYGTATQVPYLLARVGAAGALPLLIVKDGNDNKAISDAGTGTILTSATYTPSYLSLIHIGGVDFYVLQLKEDNSGVGTQRAFWASSAALTTWTEITDAEFTTIDKRGKIVQLDGTTYILGPYGIFGSDLNTITQWTASNYIPKSSEQDYSLGLIPFGGRILCFGEGLCEQFYNAGNRAGSPLRRVSSLVDRVGLPVRVFYDNPGPQTEYYCTVANRLFFLGHMSQSYYEVSLLTYSGSVFERVSGQHEERIMADNVFGIFAVTFHNQPAVGILLTAPGASPARWLMFFPAAKSWFEWESSVFSPINSGSYFAGVSNPNVLYEPGLNNWQDAGTNYQFLTQFRLPAEEDEPKFMAQCGVQADPFAGSLNVSFNDTDGATYTTPRMLDMARERKTLDACGMFRHRYVRLDYTGSSALRLRNFYATVQ